MPNSIDGSSSIFHTNGANTQASTGAELNGKIHEKSGLQDKSNSGSIQLNGLINSYNQNVDTNTVVGNGKYFTYGNT